MRHRREKKGIFSDARLSVARKYLLPASRRSMVLLGVALVAATAAYTAFDFRLRNAGFLSNGPLSSAHALLADDCAACHDSAVSTVTRERCSVCHEKLGDELGVYTWNAHYIYRTGDFGRAVPSEHETECAACHMEHRGRDAAITRVSDAECRTCHPFASFNQGHPQFDFIAESLDDDSGLKFPHISHVREIMKREEELDVEKACLYCHVAESDGKSFQPISFDRHCDTCHLTATQRTPSLPVASANPGIPGVATLAEIRRQRPPGSHWSLFMNPDELREFDGEVSKSPIYHRDPWIEENLRRLRRRLFKDPGLAELLEASADVPPQDLPALYQEAVATLESYALGLRSRPEPEIQRELQRIDDLLRGLKRALNDPLTPLDETRFPLALGERREDLSPEDAEEIELLVDDLTEVCRQCHLVEDATVARVQKDQRVLRRAEFDHRAHILDVRCLECHTAIPIAQHVDLSDQAPVAPDVDNLSPPGSPQGDSASIQNLPAISRCQECHTPRLASNRCVTCHFFHPNKSRRSEMLRYLDTDGAKEGP